MASISAATFAVDVTKSLVRCLAYELAELKKTFSIKKNSRKRKNSH